MFRKWFARLPGLYQIPSRRDRRSLRPHVASRSRLVVEALEDRVTPATPTITWDGGGGDFNWNTAANWNDSTTNLDRVPGADDVVAISSAFSAITITSANNVTVDSLTSHASVIVSGGELLLAADSQIFGTLVLNNGTFGGSGNSIVSGAFTWSRGTLRGLGSLTAAGGTAVTGGGQANLKGGFHYINPAGQTATLATGSYVDLDNASVFENAGTFDLQGDGTAVGSYDPASAFVNAGTVVKSGGTVGANYGSWFTSGVINNTGTIDVQVGTLTLGYFNGSVTTNTGTLLGAAETTLNLFATYSGSGSVRGDSVVFASGSATVSGAYEAARTTVYTTAILTGPVDRLGAVTVLGSTLDLTNATLDPAAKTLDTLTLTGTLITDDDLSVAGAFTWSRGTLRGLGSLTAAGGTAVTGGGQANLKGGFHYINPAGQTATLATGSYVDLDNASVFENAGTFDLQGDGTAVGSYDPASAFVNAGTVVKSGGTVGANYGSWFTSGVINNTGTIDVQVGTLTLGYFNGSVTTNTGTLLGAAETTLNLFATYSGSGSVRGDSVVFASGSATVSGAYEAARTTVYTTAILTGPVDRLGAVTVLGSTLDLTNATLDPAAKTLDTLTLTGTLITDDDLSVAGAFTWSRGTLRGLGSLTAAGGTAVTGGGQANLKGGFHYINPAGQTATLATGSYVDLDNASVFENAGTFDLQGDGTAVGSYDPASAFVNAGTVVKSGGTVGANYGSWFTSGVINNTGTIDVQVGTLTLGYFNGSVTTNTGTLLGAAETTLNLFATYSGSGSVRGDSVVFASGSATVSGAYEAARTTVYTTAILTGPVDRLGAVTVLGSTLDLTNATLDPAAKTLDTLTLTGTLITDDDLSVAGAFTWSRGTLRGLGSLTAAGGTAVTGGGQANLKGGFHYINPAGQTATLATGSYVDLDNASVFENAGTFDLQGDGTAVGSYDPASAFVNAGTVVKSGGTVGANYGSWFTSGVINNTGTIDVQVGTLTLGYFNGSVTTNTGTLLGAAETTLNLFATYSGSGSVRGDSVVFASGSATVSGAYEAARTTVYTTAILTGPVDRLGAVTVLGSTLDLTNATLDPAAKTLDTLTLTGTLITDDDLSVAGAFTWSRGTLRGLGSLTAAGGTAVTGGGQANLKGGFHYINPAGQTATLATGSYVDLDNASVFENAGTFDLQGDGTAVGSYDPASAFVNAGTVVKSGGTVGANYGSWFTSGVINNTGTIDVQVGTLTLGYFNGSVTTNTGTLLGAAETTLNLFATYSGSGSVRGDSVVFASGSATVSGAYEAARTTVYTTAILTGPVDRLGAVTVLGSTLDLTNATLDPAAKTLDTLTLTGTLITDDDLSVAGAFTWSRGTLRGLGSLTAAGGTAVTGGGQANLKGGFHYINPAGQTATLATGSYVDLDNASVFENAGTFDLQGDGTAVGSYDPASAFVNAGTVVKSGGTVGANYGSWFTSGVINNTGTIDVQVGTLTLGYFNGSVTTNTGTLLGAAETTLNLFATYSGSGSVRGDSVVFASGSATVSGAYEAARTTVYTTAILTGPVDRLGAVTVLGSTLDLTNATLDPAAKTLDTLTLTGTLITDDDLSVAGAFAWSRGTLRGLGSLTAAGGTAVTGGGQANLKGGFHYINPAGQTATLATGSYVDLDNASVFENAGTFDLQGDGTAVGSYDPASAFVNAGTVVKSGGTVGANYGSWFTSGVINNTGTIDVQVGTLTLGYFNGSVTTNTGTLLGAAETTLNLFATYSGSGSVRGDSVVFASGSATVSGAYEAARTTVYTTAILTGPVDRLGAVTVLGSTLDLTNATLDPAAKTLDTLTLNGTLITDDDLTVTGAFTWAGGTLQGVNGTGSLTVLSDMTLNGTYTIRDFNLINAGNAVWTGGAVNFYGQDSSFTNLAGATFDDQIDGSFGGVSDCPIFYNDGMFIKSGGTGTTLLHMQLYNSGTVQIQQGTLNIHCGYVQVVTTGGSGGSTSGTIQGTFTGTTSVTINNTGQVDVGPTDTGTSPPPPPPVSNYTQSSTGSLVERIGGRVPGTEYGQIVVTGGVNLDGTLTVVLVRGFVPALGDQFEFVNNQGSNAITGTFSGLPEGATVWAGHYGFTISYQGGSGNDVVLTATIVNQAPTASAGGPYTMTYGGTLTLNGSGSSDPESDPLTYTWAINGHANAASGVQPTFAWSDLVALGLTTGQSCSVTVTVDDGQGHTVTSDATTLTVTKADQIITFNDFTSRDKTLGTVTLTASSTSGLPVSFVVVSGPASISGNTLTITGVGTIVIRASQPGDGNYNAAADVTQSFTVIPAIVYGMVFGDFNQDGTEDFGEAGVGNVAVTLTGTDYNGTAVSISATTNSSGYYRFEDLLPGSYTLTISGVTVTKVTVDGSVIGTGITSATVGVGEGTARDVSFGLVPATGCHLREGQTAGIGFWHNKNGQALINSLNAGGTAGTATQLGNWLATTFPNMFGVGSGYDLAGKTNAQVAAYYLSLFAVKGDKLEAQVFATALSVYVTNQTLAGGVNARAYGFTVSGDGAGVATVNVGCNGAAVGRADHSSMTILDILLAVDQHATRTQSGFSLYSDSKPLRGHALDLFGMINDFDE